jgi:hypothetical protein
MPAEYLHQFDGKRIDFEVLPFCGRGGLSFGLFQNQVFQLIDIFRKRVRRKRRWTSYMQGY